MAYSQSSQHATGTIGTISIYGLNYHPEVTGLTGWWQVSGRSDFPMHENTGLDLFYVRRQSFALDLKIALKTVRVVFRGFGAF